MLSVYVVLIAVAGAAAFVHGRSRALARRGGAVRSHSLPVYHGLFLACCCVLPMLAALALWAVVAPAQVDQFALRALPASLQPTSALESQARLRDIRLIAEGRVSGVSDPGLLPAAEAYQQAVGASGWLLLVIGLGAGALGVLWAGRRLGSDFRARTAFETIVLWFLMASSAVAVLTTAGIIFSVLFETLRFFARYPWQDFLFGLQWSPQTAMRADQVGSSGAFGAIPLFVGTALITLIAMAVAGPVGLLSAIYMAEYSSPRLRAVAKPMLEILAGVPTVVFGFFAAITIAPLIKSTGQSLGFDVASESALAAGLVMGVMIIPFVSSLSDDVINAVPQALRDGSYAMGATRAETIRRVVLPAALPGIVSAFMLAISRAVGETMIVVMAAGLAGVLTFNPLEAVTTVTVQIKTLLVGDQEFDSVKTLSAFALGLVLFFFTLSLNVIALRIVRRYREQYD
jgi:phosphate transport system permease protein